MMKPLPPIYHEKERTYLIDTCRPQVRAIEEGKIDFHSLTHGHYPGRVLAGSDLPGISTIGCWDAVGEQDWGLEAHRNEGLEIHLLETGAMPFIVDGRRYDLRAGDLVITRPWQLHRLGDPFIGPGRIHWFVIDLEVRRPDQKWRWPGWVNLTREDLDDLTARLRQNERPVWRSTPDIQFDFRKIAEAVKDNRGRSHVSQIMVHLSHLFLSLLESLRQQKVPLDPTLSTSQRTVDLFLTDLRTNPANLARSWSLREMARQCGVGTTLFVRHCRGITNASPARYLLRCRLDLAALRLVEDPGASITGIAMNCGFASSQYFASRFRRRFMCSPRDYRMKASPGIDPSKLLR